MAVIDTATTLGARAAERLDQDPAGLSTEERARYDARYRAAMADLGMSPEQFHAAYSEVLRSTPERLRGF